MVFLGCSGKSCKSGSTDVVQIVSQKTVTSVLASTALQ